MTISPARVTTGAGRPGGYIFRGPLTSPLPVDATTAVSSELESQGAVGNEGLSRAITKAYEIIRDWRGDEMKRAKTETSVTVTFELIEAANGKVTVSVFGEDAVTVVAPTEEADGTITVAYSGEDPDPSAWVFDMADGRKLRRIVAPHAQMVTESFEQTFASGAPIAYPVELTFFKDEDGHFFYEYATDGTRVAV